MKLIDIDELASVCGFFTTETNLNNGYGCLSKSKKKIEKGKCFAFDCPLAYMPDLQSIKELNKEWYEEIKKDYKNDIAEGIKEEDIQIEGDLVISDFKKLT